ncbi:NAD(P)-dependent oxidoreductase [Phytoactinopolyspora limicola]|uniref:NAD(P)-dependent oxidoreductase n=1 Tax=Phytoactinopolyspora limicola TaxID=2715536 RepID=UPI001408A096|nr:NAD(P)-binding oxidoreductase [Phytoactinopolyspora limicola]
MHICILGATGGTGRHLVDQSLGRGHSVTALVRTPAKLADLQHDQLDVVAVDAMDPVALEPHIARSDAVVSAIGPVEKGPSDACAGSANAITAAMHATKARRVVLISAAGPYTDGDGPFTRFVVKPMLRRMLRHPFADMVAMETVVQDSDLDWTIMRPPMLTNKAHTGRYRVRHNANVRRGYALARANLASAILDVLDDQTTFRIPLGVAR